MKWTFSVIFVIIYHLGDSSDLTSNEISLILHEPEIECNNPCHRSDNALSDGTAQEPCQCFTHLGFDEFASGSSNGNHIQLDKKDRLFKRDTLQDLTTKIRNRNAARKSLGSLSTDKIRNNALKKKTIKNIPIKTKYTEQQQKQPVKYKELQDRFKDLKMRMSGNPKLGARGNFDEDGNLDNIIQQFKKRQEEFKEKIKIGNVKPLVINTKERQNKEYLNKLQHNFHGGESKPWSKNKSTKNEEKVDKRNNEEPSDDVDKIRLESASPDTATEASKISHIPVIILTPSTPTTPQSAPIVKSGTSETTNTENNGSDTKKSESVSSAIEKIKGKQKEVVSKILDKISKAS